MVQRKVAAWILPKHRINVDLIANLYKDGRDKTSIGGWQKIEGSERISVYEKNGEFKLVFKGTSRPTLVLDLIDDFYLTIGDESSVKLIREGNELIKSLINSGIDKSKISLTGHSLGGYAANSVGRENMINAIVFNAAAPPTAPILSGGAYLTNYHIVGDIISSHNDDKNGLTIRANKNTNFLNSVWNHGLDRFYADDPTFSFWDATRENSLFNRDRTLLETTFGAVSPISSIFEQLHDIPGVEVQAFQPVFQDNTVVTRKEVAAAWKGKPLTKYSPTTSDTLPIDDKVESPKLTRLNYNKEAKNRVMANDLVTKRRAKQYFEYGKTLKSSMSYLKKSSQEPILWRTRKEYNETMRGRVIQKPHALVLASNKNV